MSKASPKSSISTKASTFGDILSRPATDFEAPPPIPVGEYVATVQGLPEYGQSTKKKTPQITFFLKLIEARDTVDEKELEDAGGLPERPMKYTLYATEDASYRIRQFCEHCGIEVSGKSLQEAIEETPGCQLLVSVGQEMAQYGSDRTFTRIQRTAPAE